MDLIKCSQINQYTQSQSYIRAISYWPVQHNQKKRNWDNYQEQKTEYLHKIV